ncbi:hypothetical protein RHMOL_Rhmol07G0289200 [Rhododendron molle]|uniref:Uncharacterized protein n=4 Tax=Rhododendron molle TaxID=49168 RepID=A0ACC0N727_RHOML|nr:hypothetical protein RHMOL_Rhmol07G0289200 [Rhododendron molle]KAI8548633.1 hypothetical protein RHMOL_Rhmol07G0289200 [Rhododendron molle]KAI8548634.1 hypothetical protein RHMOL_Rhmol07G0289200 [Rhododendron molle]KAI8548635.1 hypothetical protein RHMOL_Rhmol07G0289200 [Rhododendron molle]
MQRIVPLKVCLGAFFFSYKFCFPRGSFPISKSLSLSLSRRKQIMQVGNCSGAVHVCLRLLLLLDFFAYDFCWPNRSYVSVTSVEHFEHLGQAFHPVLEDKLLQQKNVRPFLFYAYHFGGKLHLGYMQVREKLAELQVLLESQLPFYDI